MGMMGGLALSGTGAESLVARALWVSTWHAYRHAFIDTQGRVIDYSADAGFTTSEGQAYALFFSLVADDRPLFRRLLAWTDTNLADGRLGDSLPSWKWGQENGSWGIIGRNSASDADSWTAYALLEAARIWGDHNLGSLGHSLAMRIINDESVTIDGFGRVLIPGLTKFPREAPVLVNPSYTPLFLVNGIANLTGDPRWGAIAAAQPKLIDLVTSHGFAPDWAWVPFKPHSLPAHLPQTGTSSFDAIRCYLWAGLNAPDTPGAANELALLSGMADYLGAHAAPPQSVEVSTGTAHDSGSIGFSGALLPYLRRLKKTRILQQQLLRVLAARQPTGLFGQPAEYYPSNLILFGLGGLTDAIRFTRAGMLASS
jgi:endo-1,4-beta-D-glucanase Y